MSVLDGYPSEAELLQFAQTKQNKAKKQTKQNKNKTKAKRDLLF